MLACRVCLHSARGIRAKKFYIALFGVQIAQRVGHQLVLNVSVGVHDEAIIAESASFRRARQQNRQIDSSRGELLQNGNQTSGFVGPLEHDYRRLVVASRAGHGIFADQDEPGLVSGMVGDVFGNHIETVNLGGVFRRDRGEFVGCIFRDLRGGFGRRVGGENFEARIVFSQKCMALGRGYGYRHDARQFRGLDAFARDQTVLDVEHDLALNQQFMVEYERILREVDRSLDRVLDRHESEIHLARFDRVQNVGHGAKRDEFVRRQVFLAAQGLLGEGAGRTEVGDSSDRIFCHRYKATVRRNGASAHLFWGLALT